MAVYEFKCNSCDELYEFSLPIRDYDRSEFICLHCNAQLTRYYSCAPNLSIPYNMQASPKKEAPRVPINIIDEKPGGGYKVTRIGKKSDIENE